MSDPRMLIDTGICATITIEAYPVLVKLAASELSEVRRMMAAAVFVGTLPLILMAWITRGHGKGKSHGLTN